ncbi:MAG: hypothetical protein EOP48_00125 [Sphingobacteriales bacterium]|nr:MAG: hypothetical protein EOP48_00125 [Sphingobacteriales bacterium]
MMSNLLRAILSISILVITTSAHAISVEANTPSTCEKPLPYALDKMSCEEYKNIIDDKSFNVKCSPALGGSMTDKGILDDFENKILIIVGNEDQGLSIIKLRPKNTYEMISTLLTARPVIYSPDHIDEAFAVEAESGSYTLKDGTITLNSSYTTCISKDVSAPTQFQVYRVSNSGINERYQLSLGGRLAMHHGIVANLLISEIDVADYKVSYMFAASRSVKHFDIHNHKMAKGCVSAEFKDFIIGDAKE